MSPLPQTMPFRSPRWRVPHPLAFLSVLVILAACNDSHQAIITDCTSTADAEAICRFHNPEDMERLPDGKSLLISQMGNMEGSLSGTLVAFNTETGVLTPLFPKASHTGNSLEPESWGQPHCTQPPGAGFSPHGLSLKQRLDQKWQVAVVNHGERESVEFFELLPETDGFSLQWRGCVIVHDDVYMNDVALLRSGGFVASHMFDRQAPTVLGMSTGIWKSQLGLNTGYAFEWQPGSPETFRVLKGSAGPFPNGVLISTDEKNVFLSLYAANEIRKLDLATGAFVGSVPATQVDNMAWDLHGAIVAASHTGSKLDQLTCTRNPGQTCGFGYTILRVHPDTLQKEMLWTHPGGAPMGAATVALELGNAFYLGSFSGNRIIRKIYRG